MTSHSLSLSVTPDYSACAYGVRPDLATSHQETFRNIASAGTWFTGAQRVAIAHEARAARDCDLCAQRKAALSPMAVNGVHDGPGELEAVLIDAIHRVITDPGRLSRSWCDGLLDRDVIDDAAFAELVSVAVVTHAIDLFAIALGSDIAPFPEPEPGAPARQRPQTAVLEGAWIAQIPVGEAGGNDWSDLYGEREVVPQIGRALSLVPAEVRQLQAIAGAHYMELDYVIDPAYCTPGRVLDRQQMELIASRVSSINDCFY